MEQSHYNSSLIFINMYVQIPHAEIHNLLSCWMIVLRICELKLWKIMLVFSRPLP